MTRSSLALLTGITLSFTSCGLVGQGDTDSRSQSLGNYDPYELSEEVCFEQPTDTPSLVGMGKHDAILRSCTKYEGSDIGSGSVSATVGGTSISVDGWRSKDGEPGEFIGFTLDADGPVHFVVKAGNELYEGAGNGWVHPAGTSGPSASGISYVAFCDPALIETTTPGGDGGGDTETVCIPPMAGERPPGDSTPGDTTPPDDGSPPDDQTTPGDGGSVCESGASCQSDSDCVTGNYCGGGCCLRVPL